MSEELKKLKDAFDAWMACDEGAELTSADYPVLEALLDAIPAALGRRGAQEEPRGLDITAIIQRVAELPDRTSPADWPEAMLVTADELAWILTEAELASAALRGVGVEAGAHGGTPPEKEL